MRIQTLISTLLLATLSGSSPLLSMSYSQAVKRLVVSRQGQCAWQLGRVFCVERGIICMADSRGNSRSKGDSHRPLLPGSGSLPTTPGPLEAPYLAL